MKEVALSKYGRKNKGLNLVAIVDDECFEYLNQFNWCAHYNAKLKNYYAERAVYGRVVSMHRLIMGVVGKNVEVDHIDHNPLNNRRSNLRIASHRQNACNRRSFPGCTSKYVGVSWHKREKKWRSQITDNGKKVHLGSFRNEIEAAMAYDNAAINIHKEFANLNFKTL